jgi:ABC-type Fe3+ transport system permease subunit
MAILVWFMTGIALWHFTVFLPDRFWQGIVGAFLGAVTGAVVSGAFAQIAAGRGVGDTDLGTVFFALPGIAIGLGLVYMIGLRTDQAGHPKRA